jgi:GlcNAc-P-P-Und epimerase
MQILLTGASGFLGKIFFDNWQSEHEVRTLGRNMSNTFQCDLISTITRLPKFDIVVHAAGKAHVVPGNPIEEKEFYEVNVNGTANLLKALETNPPKTFVFISSVAVYGLETGENINETARLAATTPYGKSKIEAERIILEWGSKNGVKVLIFRPPLIFGPHATGHLGAMVQAIKRGYYFSIGKASARRSVVLGSDIAKIIPKLLNHEGIYNLTDGYHPSIKEMELLVSKLLNKKVLSIPFPMAKALALVGDVIPFFPINSNRFQKLSSSLTFSDQLARDLIMWNPTIYKDFAAL